MSLLEGLGFAMATQFSPFGDRIAYRKDNIGAPIAVTAGERLKFIRSFGLQFVAHMIGYMLLVIAVAMLTDRSFPKGNGPGGYLMMGTAMVGGIALLCVSLRWHFHAPARALAGRIPFGAARSRAQLVGPMLAKDSYWKIAGRAGSIAIVAPFLISTSIWAAAAALAIAVFGFVFMATWKYRTARALEHEAELQKTKRPSA